MVQLPPVKKIKEHQLLVGRSYRTPEIRSHTALQGLE